MDLGTSEFIGIYNQVGTEVSPFGILFGGVENILGIARENYHKYYTNHYKLRELFYDELYRAIGLSLVFAGDRERFVDARLVGLFLINDWQYKDGTRLPTGEEEPSLCYLDSILQATYNKY